MAMYPPPPQTEGPPATGNASGPRAGFWRRFAGLIIDLILLGIVNACGVKPGAAVSNVLTVGKIVPLVLFIFPAMFIVILGPAAIQIFMNR